MLDTVKLRSRYLAEPVAKAIEVQCTQRGKRNNATGEWLWEFTTGELEGSYDHRLSIQVMRFEFRVEHELVSIEGPTPDGHVMQRALPRTVRRRCAPYILLEGSVHKALLGHNVYGGPEDVAAPIRWLVDRVAEQLGVCLPSADSWKVRRLDWAEVFDLGGFDACAEYVGYMRNAEYPRRKAGRYAQESLNIAGDMTAVKLYHKGPEFEAHDRNRIKKVGGPYLELQHRANMLLRCEVELRARALDELFGPEPVVGDMVSPETVQQLLTLYDHSLGKVLREGDISMQIVRTAAAVRRRLFEQYSSRQARLLYGTWMQLSALGEKETAATFGAGRMTFWRHRKLLMEAGCSWHGGDVKLDERVRLVPQDFTPQRFDPRRVSGEAPEVAAALAPYRLSA